PGAVVVPQLVEPGPVLVVGDEVLSDSPGLLRREPLLGERDELAVDPGAEHVPRLDVEVGRVAVDRRLDDLLDATLVRRRTRAGAPGLLFHLVTGLRVDRVGERGPCKIAGDVLHDEPRLALPEPGRHGGDVRADEHAGVTPT